MLVSFFVTTFQLMLDHLKDFFKANQKDIILFIGIAFISLSSFALGQLTAPRPEKTPIRFTEYDVAKIFSASAGGAGDGSTSSPQGDEKIFVASKSGKYYHYPWCSGATNIKEANKVWFSSGQQAKNAGYAPAPNCPGLEE